MLSIVRLSNERAYRWMVGKNLRGLFSVKSNVAAITRRKKAVHLCSKLNARLSFERLKMTTLGLGKEQRVIFFEQGVFSNPSSGIRPFDLQIKCFLIYAEMFSKINLVTVLPNEVKRM